MGAFALQGGFRAYKKSYQLRVLLTGPRALHPEGV
jgi:hypothetical protein